MYQSDDVPLILQNGIRLHRFEQIIKSIHFNDNALLDKNDRLYKLRPLISTLNENFRKHGGLAENISIDESMIPYYGKHYAKQFIKGKPIRFGFKNWALCFSDGYMTSFEIYTGKSADTVENTFGIGGDVVMRLIKNCEIPSNKGHKMFFDNYFTSVKLVEHLTKKGYCATGTIRSNRTEKCPLISENEMQKSLRGCSDFKTTENEDVCLVRWKDNKVVTVVTNFDDIAVSSCSRWSKESKSKINIPQPKVYANYKKHMGGVDKMDQLVVAYRSRIRQRKWWWPIFSYLFDVSVVNAWLMMKKTTPNRRQMQ